MYAASVDCSSYLRDDAVVYCCFPSFRQSALSLSSTVGPARSTPPRSSSSQTASSSSCGPTPSTTHYSATIRFSRDRRSTSSSPSPFAKLFLSLPWTLAKLFLSLP